MTHDARRRQEQGAARLDLDAQNAVPISWLNERDRYIYGEAVTAAFWAGDHATPCPTCGTMIPSRWTHPKEPP